MATYRIFYLKATGKVLICRRMSQAKVDKRIIDNPDQGYIDGYLPNPNTHSVNIETKALEEITVTVNYYDWFRQRRNLLLVDTDWTQGADSPLSDAKKTEYQTYRQTLRDLPNSVSDPLSSKDAVTWPSKPS
jgi:hypothetical protein